MKNEIKIRKMKVNDLDIIIPIGKSTKEFQVDENKGIVWERRQLENWIKSKSDVMLVAEKDNNIVGFVMFAHHVPTGKVTWENAWVHHNYQGQGIGSKMFKEGLNLLKEKGGTYLCSLIKEDSISSIKMNEKNGFSKGYKFWWYHRSVK